MEKRRWIKRKQYQKWFQKKGRVTQNNQATIIVPDNQELDDDTSNDQHFLFQGTNQTGYSENG